MRTLVGFLVLGASLAILWDVAHPVVGPPLRVVALNLASPPGAAALAIVALLLVIAAQLVVETLRTTG